MIPISTKDYRSAELAISELDPTLTGKKIDISIQFILPLVVVDSTFLTSKELVNNPSPPAIDTGVITNTLTDIEYFNINGVERFIYVTSTISGITNSKVRIYYDRQFNDMIIIPDTVLLGNGTGDTVLTNETFVVKGYVIGGGLINSNHSKYTDSVISIDTKEAYKTLPEPAVNIASAAKLYDLNGLNVSLTKNTTYMAVALATNSTLYNKSNVPAGSVNLGSVTNLFGSAVAIPTYTLYQDDINKYAVKYVGSKVPAITSDITVFLNF